MMTVFFRYSKSSLLVLFLCLGLAGALHAQPVITATTHALATTAPPPLPQLKSPVEQFRELLELSPAARENQLTNRPLELRKRILAKVQEYEAMKPDERELRLRNTQLRWYLLSFMETPPTERATQLAMVPEADRPFVQDHLAQWDRLPAAEQKEVLKYEKLMENIAASPNKVLPLTPVSNGQDSLKNLDSFLKLPPEKREQMYASFQNFFELTDAEKQKTIGVLPPNERRQMTMALRNFALLPKPQREKCLRSFAKFSDMGESERQEFLKNVERWREMSPAERQAWRQLVNSVPPVPPLPTGVAFPPPLPPRLPLTVSLPPPIPTNSSQ
ncbi:MAG: hypothetical protein JWQ04_1471 [Pedosphaera sp.]|nr:hypothetical protein [Pedosphaera sp.]